MVKEKYDAVNKDYLHGMDKIYESKLGYKFSISPIAKPCSSDVVYFTQAEFDWMKSLSPAEFAIIWNMKKENFRYDPIPEEEKAEGQKLAEKYCPQIIDLINKTKRTG